MLESVDYHWLAWAGDMKGASCDLTLKGWGGTMLERSVLMAASGRWKICFSRF